MSITIALAGNPNCGKSTLFNALTGSNQYVGNWPGVTVEKKGGVYKKDKEVNITDLPGIYSLSPYTLEEVVSREYLINEKPDVIVDVMDASNIERNLYLATQLSEIGIPMVLALNMMDVVEKNGDKIDTDKLQKVKDNMLKNADIDAKSNNHWASVIEELDRFGVDFHTDYKKVVNAMTPEKLANFLKGVYQSGNQIEVVMTPAK